MLLNNKSKLIKLTGENFVSGNLKFLSKDDEYQTVLIDMGKKFSGQMIEWLREDEKDLVSELQKERTDDLYEKILDYRIRGIILGEIVEKDVEEENKKLREELKQMTEKYEQEHQNNITLAQELEDRKHMIAEYEKITGVKKNHE